MSVSEFFRSLSECFRSCSELFRSCSELFGVVQKLFGVVQEFVRSASQPLAGGHASFSGVVQELFRSLSGVFPGCSELFGVLVGFSRFCLMFVSRFLFVLGFTEFCSAVHSYELFCVLLFCFFQLCWLCFVPAYTPKTSGAICSNSRAGAQRGVLCKPYGARKRVGRAGARGALARGGAPCRGVRGSWRPCRLSDSELSGRSRWRAAVRLANHLCTGTGLST